MKIRVPDEVYVTSRRANVFHTDPRCPIFTRCPCHEVPGVWARFRRLRPCGLCAIRKILVDR